MERMITHGDVFYAEINPIIGSGMVAQDLFL